MELKRQYRIFFKDGATGGKYWAFGIHYKTLEEAKAELARLEALEEQAKKKGYYQSQAGCLGVRTAYDVNNPVSYKIFARDASPWQKVEE